MSSSTLIAPVADIGPLLIEAMRPVKARVAPERKPYGTGRNCMAFRPVEERVAQAGAMQ